MRGRLPNGSGGSSSGPDERPNAENTPVSAEKEPPSGRRLDSENREPSGFPLEDLVTKGAESSQMTLKEMQDAIDDDSHPQHEEALLQSKKLAETMMPALQSLQKQVTAQLDMSKMFPDIKFPSLQNLGLMGANETLMKSIGSLIPKPDLLPKMGWEAKLGESAYTPPIIEPMHRDFEELADSIAEAAREREERAEHQVEVAAAQLDTLQAMAANLQQLNQQMESVDQRLSQSNKSDGRAFGWTIAVGTLTLAATIIGIISTFVLNQP